jgi:hypothetical protein
MNKATTMTRSVKTHTRITSNAPTTSNPDRSTTSVTHTRSGNSFTKDNPSTASSPTRSHESATTSNAPSTTRKALRVAKPAPFSLEATDICQEGPSLCPDDNRYFSTVSGQAVSRRSIEKRGKRKYEFFLEGSTSKFQITDDDAPVITKLQETERGKEVLPKIFQFEGKDLLKSAELGTLQSPDNFGNDGVYKGSRYRTEHILEVRSTILVTFAKCFG